MEINIYVLAERWVVVGEVVERTPCGTRTKLGRSAVVLVWGTQKGLGQLAAEGPLADTKLNDEPAGVILHERYVMRVIPCNPQRWEKWLKQKSTA